MAAAGSKRPDALSIALGVLERGWKPVPVPVGKSPKLKDWQKLKITRDNAAKYFNDAKLNVGIQMGAVSGGLTDIDLDCGEAVVLARHFLPRTKAVYGRAGKPRSHYLYICDDPDPKAWIKWNGDDRKVIVELRMGGDGKGAQSVAPGSLHPSGEFYQWDENGEPAPMSCADLKAACIKLAVAALLMRHWPEKGALHDCALGVGGFLARAGWQPAEIEHCVYAICRSLRNVKQPKQHARTARDSAVNFTKGERVYGLPWLRKFFNEKIANTIADFVAYHQEERTATAKNLEQGTAGVTLADFYAYMVMHSYIYAPSRELWPAVSVNARIAPIKVGTDADGNDVQISASHWLDNFRPVEMMTWAPGLPLVIRDRLISEGGWIERKGVSCFNLYRPPTIELGDANKAKPWVDLVYKVFPSDAQHLIKWFAQRRQRPWEKINHGLVLGSQAQGVGKDTILEGVKRAIASWNFKEILPADMFADFNPFVRCVILRINEAKDMGDVSRFEFYEHSKSYLAAPPDVLPCNEKHIKQHYVINCMGVVITTNHLTDGIYLPAEDRRHYVAWSDCMPTDFAADYWVKIYQWYNDGGDRHVAAYLDTLDLTDFDPKAPPPKTPAFWSVVNANRTTEESELSDVLDALKNPDAVTLSAIVDELQGSKNYGLREWLCDRKNRKAVNHRLENCQYRAVNNPDAKDGMWRINDRRQMVYAKIELPLAEQLKAAKKMQREAAEAAEKARQEAEVQRGGKPKNKPKFSK